MEDDPEGWATQQSRWESMTSGSRAPSAAAGDSQQTRYSGTSAIEEFVEEDYY